MDNVLFKSIVSLLIECYLCYGHTAIINLFTPTRCKNKENINGRTPITYVLKLGGISKS